MANWLIGQLASWQPADKSTIWKTKSKKTKTQSQKHPVHSREWTDPTGTLTPLGLEWDLDLNLDLDPDLDLDLDPDINPDLELDLDLHLDL